MQRIDAEVVIAGAGPAGSVVGLRLAQLGHDVCLVEKQAFPRDHVGESLAPSIEPLLKFAGVKERVEAAGFIRTGGVWLRWDGAVQFRETAEAGYQVTRANFDTILQTAGREQGVRIVQPASFYPERVNARLIIDASGRRGVTGGAKHLTAPRSLAAYAWWEDQRWDDNCSRVEALDHGWIWGAPLGNGRSVIAAFTDPCLHNEYDSLLQQSELIPRDGRRGRVHICDATPLHSAEMANAGMIRVGEAAFSIDPLSSQGVQTAIASALQAAIVGHTILRRPRDAALAVAFYQARQHAAAMRHAAIAAELYAKVAALRPTEFWCRRARAVRWRESIPPARISGDFVESIAMETSML